MTIDYAADLMEVLRTAVRMPYGHPQIEAVEWVVAKAQERGLDKVEHAARMRSVEAYTFGGEPEKLYTAFAWCLAAQERGERQHDFELLWAFKWAAHGVTRFPQIPLAQARSVVDEMARRYRESGQSVQPAHQYRCQFAMHIGDLDAAAEAYRLWGASPRGPISDCAVCEPSAKMDYLVTAGEDEAAIQVAKTALEAGLRCSAEPAALLTLALAPCLRTGRVEQAGQAHHAAYPTLRGNKNETSLIAEHVAYCALAGDVDRAFELAQRHLIWLDDAATPFEEMRLAGACAAALRLVAVSGRGRETVRRTALRDASVAGGLGDRPAGEAAAEDVAEELAEQALQIAARFDERNQSTAQGDYIREWLAAV